ncbi:MAG: glycosyltransferase family 4 protein [Ferruginibacter sp.]
MKGRERILILIEWFTPGYKAGGPIQSCVNLCVALKETYDIYVLTSDTDHGETEPYNGITTNKWITESNTGAQVYYTNKKKLGIGKLHKIINEISADFIYLNLLFSPPFVLYPLWLKFTGKIKGEMILCPRGTLYDSAISLKWYKKKPLLSLLKWMGIHRKITFHATNEREESAIRQYFPSSKIIIADNLPNTLQPDFHSCTKNPGSIRCIFIARIVPIKNLLFLLQVLQPIQLKIILTVIGPIENEIYWAACQKAISLLPGNVTVVYEGPKQNSLLFNLLRQNHLFILPTTGENFGHAIFESFLAGRPVLISDQTPWQDLQENNAGWALPLIKPHAFTEVIKAVADFDQQQFDIAALATWNYAHRFIQNPGLREQYEKLFS